MKPGMLVEVEDLDAVMMPCIREMEPEEYLLFLHDHASEIKNTRFIPPVIGSQGFGVFEVETKIPHYEVCFS